MYVVAILFACVFILAGCGASDSGAEQSSARPAVSSGPSKSDVSGKGPEEALALANKWKGNAVTSFVTTQSVNFEFPNGSKATVALPDDEMVVAIAPYIERTHPCEIHYMSGCQGEMVGVPISVLAQSPDGTVFVDETIRTMENGFLELWLPRDRDVLIRLSAQGKSVEGTIGTFANSNTCVTTLQMM
jgi:hypothetical protein